MENIKRILMKNGHQGMRVIAFALSVLLLSGTVSAPLKTFAETDMNQNAQAEAEIVPEENVDETQVDAQAEIQEEASETDTIENGGLVDELSGDNSGEEVTEETLGVTDEALSEAVTEEVIEENAEEVSETTDEVSAEETSEDAGSKETDSEEAAEELPELTPNAGAETVVAEEIVVDDSDIEALEEEETDEEISEEPFYEVQVVDGIAVSVSADPGVFPEGASLFVRAVDPSEKESIDSAVEEHIEEDSNVVTSYTFDIKVLDADGNEIQPDTSKGKVYVYFAVEEADNEELTTEVYHIDDDMNVDKLDAEVITDTETPVVVAETEGFSYYELIFTPSRTKLYKAAAESEVSVATLIARFFPDNTGRTVQSVVVKEDPGNNNKDKVIIEQRGNDWFIRISEYFSTKVSIWITYKEGGQDWFTLICFTPTDTFEVASLVDGMILYPENKLYVSNHSGYQLLEAYNDTQIGVVPEGKSSAKTVEEILSNYSGEFFGGKLVVLDTDSNAVKLGVGKLPLVITFDQQEGTGGPDSADAYFNKPLPEISSKPTKTGYTFLGYFDDPTNGKIYYDANGNRDNRHWDKTADGTLYAHWQVAESTVTLNQNGGSGGTSSVTAKYGQNMPSATMPTREGYTFQGYYDASSGGTQYYTETGASKRTWNKTGPQTLYARWTANSYTVTLDRNGGTGGSGSVSATYGRNMPTPIVLPTCEGYVFQGYYDAQTGGTQYYNANGTSARTWNKTEDTTLYARWKEKAAVTTDPTANLNLVYNGSSQALVTTGVTNHESNGTKMQYQLDGGAWGDAVPAPTNAGTYSVKYKAVATSDEYANGDESANAIVVTIANKPVTVTPKPNQSKEFGDNDPAFTYEATGLCEGDSISTAFTGALSRVTGENVGTYAITQGNLSSANYAITFTSDVLFTIVPKTAPAATAQALDEALKPTGPNLAYTGANQRLLSAPANSPAGYTVMYSTNGTDWSDQIPEASADGNYTVYVKYDNDDNHAPISGVITYYPSITVAATIGNQKYGTIEEAVTAWNTSGGTLVLQSDATLTNSINLDTNSEKTLDLNGHDLTKPNGGTAINVTNGSLTIRDSSTDGNGQIVSNGPAIYAETNVTVVKGKIISTNNTAILLTANSNLVVNDGIISGKIDGIYGTSNANITILDGDVCGNSGAGIEVNGNATTVDVQGGAITSVSGCGIDASGDSIVTVSDGTVCSNSGIGIKISETADATITGGDISSTSNVGIMINGSGENALATLTVSGGNISSEGSDGISAGEHSIVTISSGKVISTDGDAIKASSSADVNISGGEITSTNGDGIKALGSADVNVTGGEITSTNGDGIDASGNADVNVSAGVISAENGYGINSASSTPVEISGTADVGATGFYLADGSTIDLTYGITENTPIKVETENADAPITSGGNYSSNMAGYKEVLSAFDLVNENNDRELTINENGDVETVTATPYGDLSVKIVVNGEEREIPLTPANIQFLLPGLTANDVQYVEATAATDTEPAKTATLVIKKDFEIPSGTTLVIPAGMEVTIGEDVTLNNNGSILNNGILINDGTIQGSGSITNDGAGGDDGLLCNSGTITGNVSITNTNLGGIENEGEISIPEIINNGEDSGIINREKGSITSDITGDGIIINIGIITGDLTVLDNGNLDNLGKINGDISSDGKIINTGTINGDVTSSGTVYNTGELTGDVSNLEEGIIVNYNGASISGNVNNEGEFHNKGDISGDIVNNGDFENNATYDEEDESKNKIGTISGNITNNGSFLNEGEMSGDVYNSGDLVNDGEMTGDILNDGTFDNNGTLSGGISNSGELINDGNITGDNNISNSGNMINNGTIDTTGIITNHPDAVLDNGEGADISSDIDNHGTFNNDGTASGDIVNSGKVNNTGDISGDIVNHSEGELNNAGTVSGNIDNLGVVNNDEEGVISGAIKNENGASVNNNAGATISGDINNEGGTVKNDSEGTISGSIDNEGYLINKGGKVTGDVTTGNDGITITVPKDSKSDVSISEDGKITIPAGSTITTVDEKGKTNTITIPKDASGSDVTYTFDESDLNKISQAKDGTTELPAGTVITRDGEETVLEFGGVIDSKGQVTPNADPNAPQSSGDGSGASGSSDGSNAAGNAANTADTGKKPGTNSTGNGKKPANTTETDDKENQNDDDKELADDEEADEEEEDTETTEGLTDEITSGSAREDKYGSGNVRIEVESVNEDGSVSTLTGTLHGSTESILKACLTKEELERVKAGESVVVKLVVMPLEDKVPDSDKKEIEASLGNAANAPLAIGKFIDLTVMKKIGDGDWEKVTDLNEELEITIEIDKELQADGRVFYVLRYHDGEVTTLEDQDNNPETITIKTRLFSTYAIAFIAESNAVKHGFPWWILILLLILVIIASAVTGTIIYIKNRK